MFALSSPPPHLLGEWHPQRSLKAALPLRPGAGLLSWAGLCPRSHVLLSAWELPDPSGFQSLACSWKCVRGGGRRIVTGSELRFSHTRLLPWPTLKRSGGPHWRGFSPKDVPGRDWQMTADQSPSFPPQPRAELTLQRRAECGDATAVLRYEVT